MSGARAWLVGGTVRDLLLGQRPADYDIAFNDDLSPEIRDWARRLQGSWFWLDKERNQSRVILDGGRLQFDFASLRAADIEDDLRLRDFTVNAIALPLLELSAGGLIDPLGGQNDLRKGVLRTCSAEVLKDDPLRCLKGIRHHAQHGWKFDPESLRRIREAAPLLGHVAGERIRTELAYILAAPRFASAIRLLVETGLAQELLPSFDNRKFQTRLTNVQARLTRLAAFREIGNALNNEYEAHLPLRSLLLLSLLLGCSSHNLAAFAERLRLSRKSRNLLDALTKAVPLQLEFNLEDGPRVSALRMEQIDREPVAGVIHTLLQKQDFALDEVCAAAIGHYVTQLRQGRVPDLMDGNTLKGRYPTLSGQEIGDLLGQIKVAEIKGEIAGKNGVGGWLERQFSN